MNARFNEAQALFEKLLERRFGILVSRRYDLDHGHGPAQVVFHDYAIGLIGVVLLARFPDDTCRRRRRDQNAALGVLLAPETFEGIDRQHVRFFWAGTLFDQGVQAVRQQPRIERILDVNRPGLVEVVKQPGIDAGPIVDRHECTSRSTL